ncbi:hypothetical protein IQ06DRAFT_198447, partial [Phaeosphaeriaceae sp. SRC1lsM3a]
MEQFNSIFVYLPTQRIAVCKSHQQGIIKSQLQTHLDTKHRELVARTRRDIVSAVYKEAWLQPWAMTEEQVVYPSPVSAPLPHLPVYHDGVQCQSCPYINRSIKRIREHGRKEHSWLEGTSAKWIANVPCQKFHTTSRLGRLFKVSETAGGQRTQPSPSGDVGQAIAISLTQASTQLEESEKRKNNTIKPDTDRYEFAEWLNRAGWARHLKGLKRAWLLKMARKPTHKERALFEVCWAVRMIIWRAQQASQASIVGMPAMMYINRREFGNATNEKPFNAQQTENTMIKYSNAWVEIIAYIWRTHELPVARPHDNEEIEG